MTAGPGPVRRSIAGRSKRRSQQAQANLERDLAQAANAALQAKRFERARRSAASRRASRWTPSTTHGGRAERHGRRRQAAVENAKVQLQYATITAPICRPHRRADGARGQSGARQRPDAARHDQPGRADLGRVRDSRGAAAGAEDATWPAASLRVTATPPNDERRAGRRTHRVRRQRGRSEHRHDRIKGTFPNTDRPALARPVRQRRRDADDGPEGDRRAVGRRAGRPAGDLRVRR